MEMTFLLRRIARRLRRIVGRRSFERDLDDELRFHLDMATSYHVAHGIPAGEARALTQKEFGSMHRFKDDVRDAHGITTADDLSRDVRFAFRTLRRTPGFTIVALLTFALGIGANTAIFSVVNAVLLRPLPYENADRLVMVYEQIRGEGQNGGVSVPNWRDWRKQATSFEALGGYVANRAVLDGDGAPERVHAAYLSADIFPMLGVRPLAGRTFLPGEDVAGKQHEVVLSEGLWKRRYGGQRDIVGKNISIEGQQYAVIGVMPASFNFPAGSLQEDLWMPFVPPQNAEAPLARGWHWISAIGLRKANVTRAQASAEMKQIAARLEQEYPVPQAKRTAVVVDLQKDVVGSVQPVLLVLLGAVFLVLLIACANVANLLLARNASRRADVAVRVALGASRTQIARQFLTESLVLALMGACLGLGVARLGLDVLALGGGTTLPITGSIPLDWRVLCALLVAAVVCGLAFGVGPAWQLSGEQIRNGLARLTTKTTASGDMRRFRSGLVVGQIALSLMLLVGAGLLMRGFIALRATDPGLHAERVLTARINVPRRFLTPTGGETDNLLRPFLERVRAIPGVKAAGVTSLLPIEESGTQASFWPDRRAWPKPGTEPLVEVRGVSPGYFTALGIPLRSGRDLQEQDDSTRVSKVIVNEALVRLLFPGENPIGRRVMQGSAEQHLDFEIVGVVGDVRQSGLDIPARPELYASYADLRAYFAAGDASLVVKTAVDELSIVPQVRAALRDVAADVALSNVRPMDDVIGRSLADRRLTLSLFGLFAVVALVLAASGLYGVIYYVVAQRTREIGIRVALGADKGRVIRLVLGQSAVLVGAGIVSGLVAALLLSRFLARILYGVGTRDPVTFTVVPVVLAVVAVLATMVPALRAARVDPVIALRSE